MKKILVWLALSCLVPCAALAEVREFVAEGESTHVPNSCSWAASEAFRQAWDACDKAGYASCEGGGPYHVIEKRDGYCRASVRIIGTR
jgi:hypothetical protein